MTDDGTLRIERTDLCVGGVVRVVMHDPDTEVDHGGGGRYTEIERPTRLAFTWIWDGRARRTLIELDFEKIDGITSRMLDNLQRLLEAARPGG